MMIPHYYEDPHTLHVGTMPNRAYYIPASRRSDALVEHRETSDRFQLLNGSWKFRYYASIYDLQDAFYEIGYDASAFDSIPVPSVWQNHGYDHHQSAVGLLASHSLAVAQVLCEAKRVAVAHALYDDEHRLHATLLVEAQEIAVDRVALRLREDLVGVADVAACVGEVHHRDVLCLPRLCVQSQHRRQ